eukprot:Phypoly_transcript_18807.p1 GENE.Phypoly_transcript_18807~~Phypoly_transcript_18807.p1  ORF type:complete len:235 (+),score=39.49 Phypoly_transcript_18807:88-705(+)
MEQQTVKKEAPPDTKRMVRQLEETTGVAAETMEKLHQQGDQMNRIMGLNDETTAALQSSERLAKQLTFRGRVSNFFRKNHRTRAHSLPARTESTDQHKDDKKEKKEKRRKSKEDAAESDPSWVDRSKDDPFHGHPPELTSSQLEMVKEEDADLDQMSNYLSTLKEMSLATHTELTSQTKQIDQIDKQVDNNLYVLNKTNRKLGRV